MKVRGVGFIRMSDHGMTGVIMLAIFGNPVTLGKVPANQTIGKQVVKDMTTPSTPPQIP